MMHWFQALDSRLFHWVNPTLSNSVLDVIMPFLSGNRLFVPAFLIIAVMLVWKSGIRGGIFVGMLLLGILLGDTLVSNTLKHLIARPRPFNTVLDTHIPFGMGTTGSGSMPSSHAVNWFSATIIACIFYPRSWRFMLPMALLVSFSRIYNGMHYPGDILVGAILGAGSGATLVWTMDALWRWQAQRWFPLWWQHFPSLMHPGTKLPAEQMRPVSQGELDQHWMRLGYVLIFVQLFARLLYINGGRIDLQEDEAYQWIWSKHLALSYYSKPPMIAYVQWLGTHIWGDTVFGIRFFSPIISTVVSLVMLHFVARVVNARAAFWMSALRAAVPLFAVGAVLMTIDPLSVMFWTFAMVAGWRAVQETSTTRDWCWVGLWMGLGFLSKYTALFQYLSWALFFILWPSARKQLRRPGPYLALLINLVCAVPVLIWNYQHGWITVEHVANDGNLQEAWDFSLGELWHNFTHYTLAFIGAEAVILNPFFVIPALWAALLFWRRKRRNPLLVYFFSMAAPITVCYFLLTFHSRVQPNWIAPAILPLFCLGVIYWDDRWRAGLRTIRHWLVYGMSLGCVVVVLLHNTSWIGKITGHPLPPHLDTMRRVTAWKDTAALVDKARQKLMAEGKSVFIIGSHYGMTSEITFNLPEAKTNVCAKPLVYFYRSERPINQFYFWPGYEDRKGQNAIYVQELKMNDVDPGLPAKGFCEQFESVTDLGAFYVGYRDLRGSSTSEITIANLKLFAAKLKQGSPTDALSRHFRSQLSSDTQKLLTQYQDGPNLALQQALLRELDEVFEKGLIYKPEWFAEIKLSVETAKLLKERQRNSLLARSKRMLTKLTTKRSDPDLIQLNRMLMLDAYPLALAKRPEAIRRIQLCECRGLR